MGGSAILVLLYYTILFSISILPNSIADSITPNQTIKTNETLVSPQGDFELGFFNKSKNWYLGIWYKKISTGTVVWVANRIAPLTDPSGVLRITDSGNLELLNSSGTIIWSSSSSTSVLNPIAQLLDTGNFVVRDPNDRNPGSFLWQSFDYPSDNLLPEMRLGKNLKTGLDRYFTSWKSSDDPSPGGFTYRLDPRGNPQFFMRSGDVVMFRAGPWNGLRLSGFPQSKNTVYSYGFMFEEEEVYFYSNLVNDSVVTRLVLDPDGLIKRYVWDYHTRKWDVFFSAQNDPCDTYALCGVYSTCNITSLSPCWCLKGFVAKFQKEWDMKNWSNGCVRTAPLDCQKDWFFKYSGIKLPDTRYSWFDKSMDLFECEKTCLKHCNCTAYTDYDVSGGGSGCLLWFGDLVDVREYKYGQDLHVRMAASERGSSAKRKGGVIAASVTSVGMLIIGLSLLYWVRKRKQAKPRGYTTTSKKEDIELPLFGLSKITDATNNFSEENKLGEGGFGPVYKGILMEGKEIAVKRLSNNSKQGLDEFKNEVIYIAKLQHRNLVKLLGCCIEAQERMLIYEHMPNKSLDGFIFDKNRSVLLDWPKRFNIITGIARGLLYLHQDSRLRIIHRDLKAENVLLNSDMDPKISDFGIARRFRGSETEATTKKVVGTHGYISPEYAVHGVYSMKSDVFSFGVLVLEILSGKRNRGFRHPDHDLNLLGHAWKLYVEGSPLELMDPSIRGSWPSECEVLRCVHVGLLCVQQSREDRPSMATVAVMLGGEGGLPWPKQPAFFTESSPVEADASGSNHAVFSGFETAITVIEAR
ncbi:G-type lectin S-receptor-like serine/threonine-protein kinase At4g27290 isoform X2 [Actinidia eriantha]|uniref:G-type lectin S-receptor-like serine/threonine-protein kinase At4g27290 isoform X2 n=1 Tax=Actinidia eriantha TaxID=165200 RepID=UPI00258C3AF1|nr:G-type lectin S-receptor-like serine/threonine-protein kinase At4g27290 isoform X2 [Actinidia eriantha]